MKTAWPVFELQGVGFRYPDGPQGLHDCSLRLARGRRHALLGANGAGKTTLLQQLNGLLRPSAGQIVFDGQPLDASRAGLRALRQRVGLVFQNPEHQLFSAQVFEDVSYGPLNLGLDEATVRERVRAALADVGLSAHALAPVHQLSFGQKKRVCLAGVLAMLVWVTHGLAADFVRLQGLSLAGNTRLAGVNLRATVDVQKPTDVSTGLLLARRAKRLATLNADTALGNWVLGAGVQASGARYDNAANTRRLGGYGLVNLNAQYALSRDLKLQLNLDNAFDRDYALVSGYGTPGRAFLVTLAWQPEP